MRLALISDTHMPRGERLMPQRCVEEIEAADLLLHAGDFSSEEVVAQLSAIGPPLRAVHGNVDSAGLRERLLKRASMQVEGVTIAMVHNGRPAKGRPGAAATAFPRCRRGDLRPLAAAAARASQRLSRSSIPAA